MQKLRLGQVLRNQLEHRRRVAQAKHAQTQTPASANTEPVEDIESYGQGLPPLIGGLGGPTNYYGLHTASWGTWESELVAPEHSVYQPNMGHPAFWRYPD